MKIFPLNVWIAEAVMLFPCFLTAGPLLGPWKDTKFALPVVLSQRDNGDWSSVDYREERDINERDAIKERRVKKDWVSLDPRRKQKSARLRTEAGYLRYFAVGKSKGASTVTVYLHGRGGSRDQGVGDWSFGGNFNRVKNLMFRNEGLYLCPDVTDFGEKSAIQIRELLAKTMEENPGADLFVACGSAGGRVGYLLAKDEVIAGQLSGLLLLGSVPDADFLHSAAVTLKVPVYIGHGSADRVVPIEVMENFYRSIRRSSSGYPVKMVRFETGSHGTPIRMTDWRMVLNWMKHN